ncbi:hypothetical protein Tco_0553132 [Tanacetum coccineum]
MSGVQGVNTQSHVLPIIQSQFSDINLSFVSQQATASQVIDDVIRKLSFDETELDGEASFADVVGSGVDSSGLSHDESFGVDELDLNLNEHVNLNVSRVETQSELLVFEEPDVGPTQEPILAEVSTQEPIVAEVSTQEPIVAKVSTEVPIVKEVGTQKFRMEEVVLKDYFFYDDEVIDTQSSEDAGTYDDDNLDEDFLVNEENEIVEPDIDVHLKGVDVINVNGFDSDPSNDEETELHEENVSRIEDRNIRRNLKLYKNDDVKIRARCDGKVLVFTMSQGSGPTGLNHEMEVGPSGSSGPTTRKLKLKLKEIKGDHVLQYSMLRDYVVELQSTNPNTTVKIAVERKTEPSLPTRVFQRVYICLGALKLGFRACRRYLLGLDDAFMKGPFPGQVLVAVGLDSNNGIYLLAYALVEAESKSSWCWFLQ